MYLKKLCLTLALLAVGNALNAQMTDNRTIRMDKHASKFDPLFKQTRPVCFGRFIIDIPGTAVVSWGPTAVDYGIVSYPDQGNKVLAQIQDKEREIKEIKVSQAFSSLPTAYIGTFDSVNPGSKIVVGYSDFMATGIIQVYSFIRIDKQAFVQKIKSAPLGLLPNGKSDPSSYVKYVSEMKAVAQRLRLREETEIPSEPGICIENGFVPVEDGRFHEMTSIGFSFPEYPDVRFSISATKTDRPNPNSSLEATMESGKAELLAAGMFKWFNGIRTLRKGERQVGEWKGSEVLMRVPSEEKGMPSTHEFKFKSIGVANDIFRPMVTIEMSTGVADDTKASAEPSLKDEEAMALWDRLSAAIRARPVNGL